MTQLFCLSEQDYRAIEPLYQTCRAQIPTWDRVDVQRVQRTYRFGYNRAARMLEHLAEVGVLCWDSITGKYSAPAATSRETPRPRRDIEVRS
jgi:hypothetical protein